MGDLESERSFDEFSEDSGDESFRGSEDEEEWTVDNKLLCASSEEIQTSEEYRGVGGNTTGLKRFFAMINSLEQRAKKLEEKKANKNRESK